MKRREMMNIPARTLNMCEKLHDLCDVEIRRVRPSESESREVVDGHVEAAMLSPRFEYFVAESLCGLSHDQAIIKGVQTNEVLKSDRYKRLWRRLYMANYLALPVSDDLTKALGLYADEQHFQLPNMDHGRNWIMYATDWAEACKGSFVPAEGKPRRQLMFVHIEDNPSPKKFIVDLFDDGVVLRELKELPNKPLWEILGMPEPAIVQA